MDLNHKILETVLLFLNHTIHISETAGIWVSSLMQCPVTWRYNTLQKRTAPGHGLTLQETGFSGHHRAQT